jgi:hypothetical protein
LSETYGEFITQWKQNTSDPSTDINFYGLRDFYNLIGTFNDLIKNNTNKDKLEDIIDNYCDLAIYRNFNGQRNGYEFFK